MSIPPSFYPDGTPYCPSGYGLSPDQTECIPITPPIKVDAPGVAAQEVDPSQFARQAAGGYKSSGIIGDFVARLFSWPIRQMTSLVSVATQTLDAVLASLSKLFFAAQAQRTPEYFALVAALLEDLLGIATDGRKLYDDFQAKGRLAAVEDIGAGLFNALASEFAHEKQADSGSAWKISPGTGIGGLPAQTLTPAGGVDAARALMGFAMSFAIREGNTDFLADLFPLPAFRAFKDFAEDFSKSIGLGRLVRLGIRPLMQVMVAEPLQQALNFQYTPKILSVSELAFARNSGSLDDPTVFEEYAMNGYNQKRAEILSAHYGHHANVRDLWTLFAAQVLTDTDLAGRLRVQGYTEQGRIDVSRAMEWEPARSVTAKYAEHYVTQFLEGHITAAAAKGFLDALTAQLSTGKVPLTSGEILHLRDLVDTIQAAGATLRPRHLSVAQLQLAYIDGTITLQDFEDHLAHIGYVPDDVTILTVETLIKAKDKAAAAAKKAAKGKIGTPTPGSAASPTGG